MNASPNRWRAHRRVHDSGLRIVSDACRMQQQSQHRSRRADSAGRGRHQPSQTLPVATPMASAPPRRPRTRAATRAGPSPRHPAWKCV